MLIRLLVLIVLLAPAGRAQPLPPAADSLARAFMAQTGAPSLVVAVSRGGLRTVAGYGEVAGARPDAATRYEIASVTKTFTALALADAVARSEVALDTPAQALLPDSVRLAVVNRPVTLGDLITHGSGLPRLPAPFAPASMLDPYADFTEADLMRFAASVRPDSAGVRYGYSNAAVGLLGWMLARRDGTTYADLVARRVLAPLGLASTSTGGPVAQPYMTSGTAIAAWTFTEASVAAGGLRSSADDLLRYAEAVARPDERAPTLADAIRLATAPRFASPGRFRIGLAWHLLPETGPVEVVFHNGATFGSVAFVGVVPERDLSVVLLSNVGAVREMDALAFGVLRALRAETAQAEN